MLFKKETMKQQVLEISQMQHLYTLGLKPTNASMKYVEDNNGKILCIPKELEHNIKDCEDGYVICDALSLQDILSLLPPKINKAKLCVDDDLIYYCHQNSKDDITIGACKIENNCLIDAAYRMLCMLIENRYIEVRR